MMEYYNKYNIKIDHLTNGKIQWEVVVVIVVTLKHPDVMPLD